jgi:hypothetical protein
MSRNIYWYMLDVISKPLCFEAFKFTQNSLAKREPFVSITDSSRSLHSAVSRWNVNLGKHQYRKSRRAVALTNDTFCNFSNRLPHKPALCTLFKDLLHPLFGIFRGDQNHIYDTLDTHLYPQVNKNSWTLTSVNHIIPNVVEWMERNESV